jgi:membrane-bound lytic murein transglycosylase C
MRVVRYTVLLVALVMVGQPEAQQEDDFSQLEAQEQAAFAAFALQEEEQFNQFVQAEQQAFEQFKAEVEALWGQYEPSSKKEWVEYGQGLQSRSHVDFEEGVATVEVIVEEGDSSAAEKLQSAVAEASTAQGTSSDYAVPMPDGTAVSPVVLGDQPVLQGQLTTTDGAVVTSTTAPQFAKEVVQANPVRTTSVTGSDGKTRTKATVTFNLVPDHLRKRAARYLPIVRKHARHFSLDVPLVFALMHTESFFNPKARSSAPAYGLMQLVPKSGGRAAYEFVYKKDRIPPPTYLYVPDQNVELGCAYLAFVQKAYFAKVKEPESARYCVVSSYNTGAGNVSRAFTGRTKVSESIPYINRLTPSQLYQHLQQKLPYEETRNYIRLVTERMSLYEEWR